MKDITPEMLEAGKAEMKQVDAAIQYAVVHGFILKYTEGESPLIRAYRAMRALEPKRK